MTSSTTTSPAKPATAARAWYRKPKILIVISIMTTLLVGLALGVGLGLGLHTDNPRAESSAVWQPSVGSTWQIVLIEPIAIDASDPGSISPDVDVWDIDLFSNPTSTISALHSAGKKVICYWSAGSYEEWRPDAGQFNEEDLGAELDGWPGERWLNLSSTNVRDIMSARMQLSSEKGCDAVDPDNVDGYQNENGLGLTKEDSIDFMDFLHGEAAKYDLAMGLKNAGDIIPDVLPWVQFSVNEQCSEYNECDVFAAFIDDDKPVFHIEYPSEEDDTISDGQREEACSGAGDGFSTVLKNMDLDGFVMFCDGSTANTGLDTE